MIGLELERTGEALRVLAIGAHADDIEIGCGGLILTLIAKTRPVIVDWCVLSATTARAEEARASAAAFLDEAAGKEIRVEGFTDGFFPYEGAALKRWFETLKGRPSPDLVLTHRRRDRHQDHREVANLTWNTFRDHLILEYEIPKYEGDLETPNLYVPLTDGVVARKVELLLESFASQRQKPWFDGESFRSLCRLRGIECASPTRYAEAFHAPKMVLA
jgi:LmbE family N-acetylglucosaminyl deacetylase